MGDLCITLHYFAMCCHHIHKPSQKTQATQERSLSRRRGAVIRIVTGILRLLWYVLMILLFFLLWPRHGIVQRYIPNPLLIGGRKPEPKYCRGYAVVKWYEFSVFLRMPLRFDLRIYVVVLSWGAQVLCLKDDKVSCKNLLKWFHHLALPGMTHSRSMWIMKG
jgi:hypothetical protein